MNRAGGIGSDNGLSPIRRQVIISINAGSLSNGTLGTNFSENIIKVQNVSFTKMHLKIPSAKWRTFCPVGGWASVWLDIYSNMKGCNGVTSQCPNFSWSNEPFIACTQRIHSRLIVFHAIYCECGAFPWQRINMMRWIMLQVLAMMYERLWITCDHLFKIFAISMALTLGTSNQAIY